MMTSHSRHPLIFLAFVLGLLLALVHDVAAFSRQPTRMMSSQGGPNKTSPPRGRLLVLGGTGFLGQAVCQRAILEGYHVTALSRRGQPSSSGDKENWVRSERLDYVKGDARQIDALRTILENDNDFVGVIHVVGLLLDNASGLADWNRFASGSGSIPDENSSYDQVTRLTAFHAIDATLEYVKKNRKTEPFPFVFMSAAEAGWPDVQGGPQIEEFLAPEWLKRYLKAKRTVEQRLLEDDSSKLLRPIIPRASLIYSMDKPASFLPVAAFAVGNRIGLPFVDRPVTVQALANAIVQCVSADSRRQGILRYSEIDQLNDATN